MLGQSDYALGEFKDAAVAWERVRRRQPQFQPVYFDLADDYVKLDERHKALDVLKAPVRSTMRSRRCARRSRWRRPEERERQEALKVYQQYLGTGGPYGDLANEGIARLTAAAPRRRR